MFTSVFESTSTSRLATSIPLKSIHVYFIFLSPSFEEYSGKQNFPLNTFYYYIISLINSEKYDTLNLNKKTNIIGIRVIILDNMEFLY